MDTAPHPVAHRIAVELIGPDGPVAGEAELGYNSGDPYAVTFTVRMAGTRVTWVFGRDLLMRGLCEPVGEGDVLVSPSLDDAGRSVVVLVLRSLSGQAVLQLATQHVLPFLACTIRAVWPGTEGRRLGTDAAIAAMLLAE